MVRATLHIRQMTGLHQCPFMADLDTLKHPFLLTATTLILQHTQSATTLDHGR
jgi:hypothetical protein